MSRTKMVLSKKTLESIGIKPYRHWDEVCQETTEGQKVKEESIEITPNKNGIIPRPYSAE